MPHVVTKSDLVQVAAKASNLSKAAAGEAVNAVFDAIGARWLVGIARNLVAHPGLDDDGLRWLAFERLSGQAAPPEKAPLAAAVATTLPPPSAARLVDLASHRDDAAGFAATAAAWVRDASAYIAPPSASSTCAVTSTTMHGPKCGSTIAGLL